MTLAKSKKLILIVVDGLTPAVTNITYDGAGHRTGMQDATGTSTWAWDSLDRRIALFTAAALAMTHYQLGASQVFEDLRGDP